MDESFIFAEAMSRTGDDRRAYLNKACGSDEELRQRLEAMLRLADDGGGSLNAALAETEPASKSTGDFASGILVTEQPGDWIGSYKLLEKLGEGGFGVVFLAEQREPILRRVALKIIKQGMDTKQVIARFEAERQAVAMMDHPNIAKILDAGATERGRPYFVMELVRGIRITKFCDERRFDVAQRLELFCDICSAVQHAHQKGVIHRDLKPSNILIGLEGDKPVAKIIDFGIAKATHQQLTDKTLFTLFEQFIGTPIYISPEQASLSVFDVDTRSDIYSLGVLLYELLTGMPPFDSKALMSAGLDELRRIIREKEAPKPSTRLSTVSAEELQSIALARRTEPKKLGLFIKGDLDWIILKALEKDRSRRYETPNALRTDLQRFLCDEPVNARPPSSGYRLRKFARRHRRTLAAAAVIALTLMGGLAATTWQAIRANESAREAKEARNGERELCTIAEQRSIEADEARIAAEIAERTTREKLYAADMVATQRALDEGDLGKVRRFLSAYLPVDGKRDLRGFSWRYFWDQAKGDQIHTFRGHDSVVSCLTFSPDGRTLVSGDQEGRVIFWDVEKRERKFGIEVGNSEIVSVAFSHDGKMLGVGGSNLISLFNLDREGPPRILLHRPFNWPYIYFIANSKKLLIGEGSDSWGYNGGWIRIWDYEDETVQTFRNAGGKFAIAEDEHILFTGLHDGLIRKWDLTTGTVVASSQIGSELASLACSPDGRWLVTSSGYPPSLTTLRSGQSLDPIRTLIQSDAWFPVKDLTFGGGRFAGSSRSDSLLRIWDPEVPSNPIELVGHGKEIRGCSFSPDGKILATCGEDGTVRLWKPEEPGRERSITGFHCNRWCTGPALSPDGQLFASGSKGRPVTVWDTKSCQQLGTMEDSTFAIAFVDGGKTLVTVAEPTTLQFFDVNRFSLISDVQLSDESKSRPVYALSPDRSYFGLGSSGGSGTIWKFPEGEKVCEFQSPRGGVMELQFLPDNSGFLTANSQGGAIRWDMEGQRQLEVKGHRQDVYSVAVSPDGKQFATGSVDNTVKIWDTEYGMELETLAGHTSGVTRVRFSPQGDTLVSLSAASTRFWDTRTWREVAKKKTSRTHHLAFSDRGCTLALVSKSGSDNPEASFMFAPPFNQGADSPITKTEQPFGSREIAEANTIKSPLDQPAIVDGLRESSDELRDQGRTAAASRSMNGDFEKRSSGAEESSPQLGYWLTFEDSRSVHDENAIFDITSVAIQKPVDGRTEFVLSFRDGPPETGWIIIWVDSDCSENTGDRFWGDIGSDFTIGISLDPKNSQIETKGSRGIESTPAPDLDCRLERSDRRLRVIIDGWKWEEFDLLVQENASRRVSQEIPVSRIEPGAAITLDGAIGDWDDRHILWTSKKPEMALGYSMADLRRIQACWIGDSLYGALSYPEGGGLFGDGDVSTGDPSLRIGFTVLGGEERSYSFGLDMPYDVQHRPKFVRSPKNAAFEIQGSTSEFEILDLPTRELFNLRLMTLIQKSDFVPDSAKGQHGHLKARWRVNDLTSFAGNQYKLFPKSPQDWEQTRDFCESLGGHLAIVNSAAEHEFLCQLKSDHLGEDRIVWLGGYMPEDGDQWVWIDGNPIEANHGNAWNPRGNQTVFAERFLVLDGQNRWSNLTIDSELVNGFICEWETRNAE